MQLRILSYIIAITKAFVYNFLILILSIGQMEIMHLWESSGNMILQALGWTVVHAIWQGAVIATLIAVVFSLLPREAAAIRYKLAYAGLIGMVVWSVWTFGSELNQPEQLTIVYENHLHHETTTITIEGLAPLNSSWLASFKNQVVDYIPWVAFLWVLGALFFSLRWIGSFVFIRRLRQQSRSVNHPLWQQKVDKITAYFGFGRKVHLMISERIFSPMVVGHLRPVILLPVGFLAALSPTQVEAILVHELAHIRRNDYLLNIIQQVLEVLFFYHPAYWWLSQVLQDEREHCCDDIVVQYSGDSLAYAKALTELEQHRITHTRLAMGIQGRNNHMLGRIKRIMGVKQQNVNMNTRLVTFLIMSMSLCGLAWIAPAHLPEIQEVSFDNPPVIVSPHMAPEPEIRFRNEVIAPDPDPIIAIEPIEMAPNGFAIAGVDSPPPPPPAPPVYDDFPVPPPPPPVNMPPLPPMDKLFKDGVPDHLNPDELTGEIDEKAMEKFQMEMEKWGQEYGEKYSQQMEAYAKEMAKWEQSYEKSHGEEYAKKMEKYAREMERWGEQYGKEYAEKYERMARDYERAAREQARDGRYRERDRDRVRELERHAELEEKVARELAEKLRALEKMEVNELQGKEEALRKLKEELRRVEENVRAEEREMRRQLDTQTRALEREQREQRELERARRMEETRMRSEQNRMREEQDRMRAEERRLVEEERRLYQEERQMREREHRMQERYEVLKKELYEDGVIKSSSGKINIVIDEDGMTVNGKKVNRSLENKYFRMLDIDERPETNSRINIKFD